MAVWPSSTPVPAPSTATSTTTRADVFLDLDRADLLDDLMSALNALAAAGCTVTVKDGKLWSAGAGFVVPSTRGRWASRPLVSTFPSSRPLGEFTDEDGFF